MVLPSARTSSVPEGSTMSRAAYWFRRFTAWLWPTNPPPSPELIRQVEAEFARIRVIPPDRLTINGVKNTSSYIPLTNPETIALRDDIVRRANAKLAEGIRHAYRRGDPRRKA